MWIILEHGEALHDDVHSIGPVGSILYPTQHSLQSRIILRDLLVVVILALYSAGSPVNENDRPIKFERLMILCRSKDGNKAAKKEGVA